MAYVQYHVGLGSGARQSVRRKKKMSMDALSAGLAEIDEAPPPPPPARKVWEFDRAKLSDLRQIGEGNFGVVYLAKVRDACGARANLANGQTGAGTFACCSWIGLTERHK